MTDLPKLERYKSSTITMHPYEHRELKEKLDHVSTTVLLDQLDEELQVMKPYDDQQGINYNTVKDIEVILAERLGFPIEAFYNEDLTESLNRLVDKVNELIEVFKNHRHDKDKNYTEKPVW